MYANNLCYTTNLISFVKPSHAYLLSAFIPRFSGTLQVSVFLSPQPTTFAIFGVSFPPKHQT